MMGHLRHVILHYHIFKNAGTTFCAALSRNFGDRFAQLHSPQHDQRLSPEALVEFVQSRPEVLAVSSHHLSPPAPKTASICFHDVLIVRDPLDRIRSMYDFYRRARVNDDPLTADAKRLKLPEFLEHLVQTRRHLVTNAQTNVVANAGHKIPDASDLERAAVMVREASAVGLVENYDLCALQAETSLRPFFPGIDLSYIRENVTPLRGGELEARLRRFAGECGQELYKTLLELNRLDMELVKIVKAESLHRWQIMDRQQTTMRSFRRRVQQRRIVDAMSHHILKVRRLFGRALHLLSPEP